jgi:hypothetical protein
MAFAFSWTGIQIFLPGRPVSVMSFLIPLSGAFQFIAFTVTGVQERRGSGAWVHFQTSESETEFEGTNL